MCLHVYTRTNGVVTLCELDFGSGLQGQLGQRWAPRSHPSSRRAGEWKHELRPAIARACMSAALAGAVSGSMSGTPAGECPLRARVAKGQQGSGVTGKSKVHEPGAVMMLGACA